jgi:hypothetical protein
MPRLIGSRTMEWRKGSAPNKQFKCETETIYLTIGNVFCNADSSAPR